MQEYTRDITEVPRHLTIAFHPDGGGQRYLDLILQKNYSRVRVAIWGWLAIWSVTDSTAAD